MVVLKSKEHIDATKTPQERLSIVPRGGNQSSIPSVESNNGRED